MENNRDDEILAHRTDEPYTEGSFELNTPKQDLLELLGLEPDDVSLDQIIDDFEFAARVRRGSFELQHGCTMTPERLQQRLAIHFMSHWRETRRMISTFYPPPSSAPSRASAA